MIYTLYNSIYFSAHNSTEDWLPGTWNGLTVPLALAFTSGKDTHLELTETQGNKGVTRVSLTVCYQAVLMSLRRICTSTGTLYCLIGGQWATRSLPVTAGKLLYFFLLMTYVLFHTHQCSQFYPQVCHMFFLFYTKNLFLLLFWNLERPAYTALGKFFIFYIQGFGVEVFFLNCSSQ